MKLPKLNEWSVEKDYNSIRCFSFNFGFELSEIDSGDSGISAIFIEIESWREEEENKWTIISYNHNLENFEDEKFSKILAGEYFSPLEAYEALKDIEFIFLKKD